MTANVGYTYKTNVIMLTILVGVINIIIKRICIMLFSQNQLFEMFCRAIST